MGKGSIAVSFPGEEISIFSFLLFIFDKNSYLISRQTSKVNVFIKKL